MRNDMERIRSRPPPDHSLLSEWVCLGAVFAVVALGCLALSMASS